MSDLPMRIALIQFNAGPDKNDNIRRALDKVRQALDKKAEFVLLPEVFWWRGDTRDPLQLQSASEALEGPSIALFCNLAKRYGVHILLGSVFERIPRSSKVYNTSVLINPQGKIQAKYRKIHLFDARLGAKMICEADCFKAGDHPVQAPVGKFKAGLSICYDLRFRDLYDAYRRAAVDFITVPAAFTQKTGQAHWEVLLRARAIENLCYVLAPAQVGKDAKGVQTFGHSMVVSPWGKVIACGSGDKEEIVYAQIDRTQIIEARAILPGIIK